MDTFDIGEVVICSITTKKSGVDTSPADSMNIVIDRLSPNFVNVIASTAMTNTGAVEGKFHYDFAASAQQAGIYGITYTATDGTRITIQQDEFKLE